MLQRVIEMNRSGAPSSTGNVDELMRLVREESRQRQTSDAELAKCFAPIKKELSPDHIDPAGRVVQLETEKAALEKRAQDAEQEQAVLTHQVRGHSVSSPVGQRARAMYVQLQIGVFHTEASALAAEARQTRREKLEQFCKNNGTVLFEEGFIPRAVLCAHAQAWFNAISKVCTPLRAMQLPTLLCDRDLRLRLTLSPRKRELAEREYALLCRMACLQVSGTLHRDHRVAIRISRRLDLRLFFLPRPPHSLPVHMPGWAKPGYWFHPEGAIVGDREFELIIENKPDEVGGFLCDHVWLLRSQSDASGVT